ncbi:MAG: response regulator [Acidobacteria bacterium]|nr:response regulator [Acidobacteriota bacterium]
MSNDNLNIKSADLHVVREQLVRESLPAVVNGLALLFLFLAGNYFLVLPRNLRVPIAGVVLVTATIFLGLRLALARGTLSQRWAHPVAAFIAALVLGNSLLLLYLTREPQLMTHLLLLSVASGFFILSTRWLVAVLVLVNTAWVLVAWRTAFFVGWEHFGLALASATVVSALVHVVRLRTVTYLQSLWLGRARQDQQLEKEMTERQRVEEEREQLLGELQKERTLLEAILEQLPSGVIIAEAPSGRMLRANANAQEILGRPVFPTAEAALQQKIRTHEGTVYQELPLNRAILNGEIIKNEEVHLECSDGSTSILSVSAAPIRDAGGRIVAGVITFNEITEMRRVEKHLRSSQRMEAIGRLAGGVAHDFNNFITAIAGYAQLMLDHIPPEDPLRRDAEEIKRTGERAGLLTRQLLAFSRKQRLQPQVLDLNAVVQEMLEMLRPLIGENIELNSRFSSSLPPVKADPGQLEQVLLNLVVNARDAMPSGGRLTVETSSTLGDTSRYPDLSGSLYCVLKVSDTGVGMDELTREHIFEPFFTTKKDGKGTGLGLATVYGIVKQHQGYVHVESRPSQGSTFYIFLPAASGSTENSAANVTGVESREVGGSETILVVEDEPSVLNVVERILQAHGYRVFCTGDPSKAEELFHAHGSEISILLTDMVMPGCNGRELYRRLASKNPRLKVLYMSGYSEQHSPDEGRLLRKPFSGQTLTRRVRQILDS